jgi:hypothetical protein
MSYYTPPMKRIYHPYWDWEDYKAGLYVIVNTYDEEQTEQLAKDAANLLSNSELFRNVALSVITQWCKSAEVNLSNPSRNRQAWIGQASCCYALKIPEFITKFGWRLMTIEQQNEANRVADEVIRVWEVRHGENCYAKKIFEY